LRGVEDDEAIPLYKDALAMTGCWKLTLLAMTGLYHTAVMSLLLIPLF